MATLAKFLSEGQTGRPVVDGTGLTGKYDFHLDWSPDSMHCRSKQLLLLRDYNATFQFLKVSIDGCFNNERRRAEMPLQSHPSSMRWRTRTIFSIQIGVRSARHFPAIYIQNLRPLFLSCVNEAPQISA